MEMKKGGLFVIVVTYNGKIWYDKCFSSLRSSLMPIKTIVIDNASSDESVAYIKSTFPEIIVLESDVNLGFGQANNMGIRYALEQDADYVFLLNQDAWIEPDTLERIVNIYQKYPQYGILSPMHLNANHTAFEKGFLCYIDNYKTTDPGIVNDIYFSTLADVYETKYVNAAAWLLPRKTLEMVGGFDPIFYHYGEDDNYLQRVRYHSFKIGIVPLTYIVHDTERRLPNSINKAQTVHKDMLVSLTDITNNITFGVQIWFHIRKIIMKICSLNTEGINRHWQWLLFILKNKKAIQNSRLKNKSIGTTWIY